MDAKSVSSGVRVVDISDFVADEAAYKAFVKDVREAIRAREYDRLVDILPFLKEEDSYGVQLQTN